MFINAMRLDTIILIVAIMLIFSVIIGNYADNSVYYGTEIYLLTLNPEIQNKTVVVHGNMISDNSKVVLRGRIVGVGRGYLVIRADDTDYKVGGPLAGKEDLAAKKIRIE